MASGPSRFAVAALVAAASGTLLLLGTGLHPIAALTWFAPLPVLLLAPRVPAWLAFTTAAAAYLLGMATTAAYLLGSLQQPIAPVAALLALTTLVFCAAVLLLRALLLRGRALLAALAVPALYCSAEYLVAVLTPDGSNWTLANTQADVLPVLQLASLTGAWGVSFLVMGAPVALAALCAPGVAVAAKVRTAAVAVLVAALALGYGVLRLEHDGGQRLRVSLVAVRAAADQPALGTPDGDRLLAADLDWLRTMPANGTRLVVFPEKDFTADDATMPTVLSGFGSLAKQRAATVVVGLQQHTGGRVFNTALAFSPDGSAPAIYHKQYPVPGVEDEVTPGSTLTFAPGDSRIGLAICADLGQVSLGRRYAANGAGLLAVPALDFDVDDWSQSRVQQLRGVENGVSVARAARLGYLTLADPTGRVLAQSRTGGAATAVSATAELPVTAGGTLYTRFGDWFAWLCLLVVASTLGSLVRGRRRAHAEPSERSQNVTVSCATVE